MLRRNAKEIVWVALLLLLLLWAISLGGEGFPSMNPY